MKAWDNTIEVACPSCGKGDQIDVVATVWTRIKPDGSSTSEAFDGSEEYDESSPAICRHCGHNGTWGEFHKDID